MKTQELYPQSYRSSLTNYPSFTEDNSNLSILKSINREPLNSLFKEYKFKNNHSDKIINILLKDGEMMSPSFSTELLIKNMQIAPNESVLDFCAGTGVVGIAAKKLGAGEVTTTDILPESVDEVLQNAKLNNIDKIRTLTGDLFSPLNGDKFDHIIVNPPSIPSLPEHELNPAHCSGPEGRDIHNPFQELAKKYLKSNGKLTMVHSSLCNLPLTAERMEEYGYLLEVLESRSTDFRDFYPLEHIKKLSQAGKAQFTEIDKKFREFRSIIVATLRGRQDDLSKQ